MKLGNKGSSLLELVISIALISIIMVFMINLLLDLNDRETNNNYAKDNQLNRSEIIRMIENDITSKKITNIDDTKSSIDTLKIEFSFKDNTKSYITATEDNFEYINSKNEKRRWTMKSGKIYVPRVKVYYRPDNKINEDKIYTLLIDIEIHTSNDNNKYNNNNTLDDILISYIGNTIDYNNNLNCLGQGC